MFKIYTVYNEIPFVKITLACIVGILIGIYFQSTITHYLLLTVFVIPLLYLLFYNRLKSVKNKAYLKEMATFLSPIIFISFGYFLSISHTDINIKSFYGNYLIEENSNVEVKIIEAPQEKTNSYKLVVDVEKTFQNKKIIKTSGKLLLYFQKDELVKRLKPNDRLYINTRINKVEGPKNPNEFDFKNYLKFQNIYNQAYVKSTNWEISKPSKNRLTNTLFSIKSYLQKIINENIFYEDEKAVASALLLGNRSFLTDDILQAFSSSGATHILAVSGLHVGLFYGIISFIFGFLKKSKRFKILHPIIVILFIWFYVALTGGSPSVMRAATMFSFVAIGFALSRYVNIYNIIAFSALIIIASNPYIITEVGFQLSYFAVIGIIYLQRKIYNLFYTKNYILDKIWAISSVSIAAQISTFPLIILYFHQFPNFFWLSNIIVIPAATVILYSGVLMFIFSFNGTILAFIGKIISYIIMSLNISLAWIEKIPNAVTDKLYISHFQALLYYLVIFSFVLCLEKRNKKLALATIFILGCIFVSYHIKDFKVKEQNKLIVYHTPKYSAIEIIEGEKAFHKIDSALLEQENLMMFRIKHNWWEQQISDQNFSLNTLKTKRINQVELLMYANKRIGFIDTTYQTSNFSSELDYLIISHTPKLNLKAFSSKVKVKTYIFDTSNDKYKERYWKKDCEVLNLNCYFVSDTTAFEIEF